MLGEILVNDVGQIACFIEDRVHGISSVVLIFGLYLPQLPRIEMPALKW